ncbi:hypothetical protein [Promicromonospora sp. NPDC023987]|uniref:hypothetical protein n=1 Tax=Promicromonospora sp. NPDC023987 TaxID=3155360 RepID=UPI0033D349C4
MDNAAQPQPGETWEWTGDNAWLGRYTILGNDGVDVTYRYETPYAEDMSLPVRVFANAHKVVTA